MTTVLKYYAFKWRWDGKWSLNQRDAHGDRQLATGMSERTARRAARLFNADEDGNVNSPLSGEELELLDEQPERT